MRTSRRALHAAVLLLLAAVPSAARAQDDMPEGVVRRSLEARDRGDWAAVAALVHPRTLEGFREILLNDLRFQAEAAGARVVEGETTGPDGEPVPACVREWEEARHRDHPPGMDPVSVYGTADSAALRRMPAAELFARQAAWRAGQGPPEPPARVVGSLSQDDSTALVFVRYDTPEWEGQPLVTMVEVKRAPEWRVTQGEGSDVLGWGFSWSETRPERFAEVPVAEGSPAAVVLRAAEAARAEDWRAVAALVHPRVLETVQRGQVRMMTMTYAELMKEGIGAADALPEPVPACVAEYFATQMQEAHAEIQARIAERFGTSDRAALLAMPAPEFFARYLESSDILGPGGPPPPEHPSRPAVVGTVMEGDSLAHVAYHEVITEPGITGGSGVQVVSVRRAPGGWRLATANAPFFYRRR